eukprot:8718052-Heterocapsa_arctica.AAC.1
MERLAAFATQELALPGCHINNLLQFFSELAVRELIEMCGCPSEQATFSGAYSALYGNNISGNTISVYVRADKAFSKLLRTRKHPSWDINGA